uniref:Uncharacterized protein n=1 Tax=Panagrolaimus sp. PS1159 TaxID=55785 RepID=A0AC35FCJ4_9BILA
MKLFDATRVSETFNFIKFSKFIKIHSFVQYRIFYDNNIELSKRYKSEIQNYVNELDADDFIKYPPPDIYFPGQTLNNGIEKLVDLRNNYVNDKTKRRHVPTRIATKRRFA